MVGVAGRSKGCANCRHRKIRCDLARPACERCKKSKLSCQGYERYPVFIVQTASGVLKRRHLEEVKPRTEAMEPDAIAPSGGNHDGCCSSHGDLVVSTSFVQDETSPSHHTIPSGLTHSSLAVSWFYESFARAQGMYSVQAVKQPSHWLYYVMQLASRSPLLDKTLLGVSIARCGKDNDNIALLAEGRRHYTHALRLLRRTLSNDNEASSDETLAAAALMVLYEMLDASHADDVARNGWHQHLAGLDRLLQHRGPHRCSSRLGKAVLEHSRHILMVRSLFTRRPSVLCERPWLEVPWIGEEKTAEQFIFDQGLLLADVFRRVDLLPVWSGATRISAAIGDCAQIISALQSARLQFSYTPPDCSNSIIWAPVSDSWTDPSAQRLLTITFLGVQLGACDTVCDLVDKFNADLGVLETQTTSDDRSYTSLAWILNNRRYLACEITHHVSAYLATVAGAMGPARLVFALQLARKQFAAGDLELHDCEDMLSSLGGSTWQLGTQVVPNPEKAVWTRSTIVSI